jgi:hypothetical protein
MPLPVPQIHLTDHAVPCFACAVLQGLLRGAMLTFFASASDFMLTMLCCAVLYCRVCCVALS